MYKFFFIIIEEGIVKNCLFFIGLKIKKGYIVYFLFFWEIKREDSILELYFKKYDDFRLF